MCIAAPEPLGEREYVATAKGARLVYLLTLWGSMTVERAADELGCSDHHIYRVVDRIVLADVPISLERGVISIDGKGRDWEW